MNKSVSSFIVTKKIVHVSSQAHLVDFAVISSAHVCSHYRMDMMSERDFFSTLPTQVALGNHDLDTVHASEPIKIIDESLEIGLAYENRFKMPQIRPAVRELASLNLFSRNGQPTDFIPYEYGNAYYSFT